MILLAFDTSSGHGSLALFRDGALLEERAVEAPDGFGHVLFGEIEALLGRHGLALGDVGRIAAASGPGSFTGIRVGLTAAKALAEATGCQVVGISTLRAVASFGTSGRRAAVIDARRGEVYAGLYGADLEALAAERVGPLAALEVALGADVEIVTSYPQLFTGRPVTPAPQALAAALGRLAERLEAVDPAGLDANYVRASDAELFWKEPRLSGPGVVP